MMNHLASNKLFLVVPVFLFFIWYIGIGVFNQYSLDDYWHYSNVQIHGFWEAQNFYYQNWEGSFSHTFFATLPHSKLFRYLFENNIWVYCVLTLGFLIFSITITLFQFDIVTPRLTRLLVSSYIVSVLYVFSTAQEDVLYWVCANITYVNSISFLLVGLFILKKFEYSRLKYIAILPLAFVVGNKINLGVLLFLLFTFLLFSKSFLNRHRFDDLFVLGFVFILYLVNLFALGNFVRLGQNMDNLSNEYSLFAIVSYRFWYIFIPFGVKSMVFIIPILTFINDDFFKGLNLKLFSIFIFSYFLVECIIFEIAFKNWGPARCSIFCEFLLIPYCVAIWIKLIKPRLKIIPFFPIFIAVVFSVYNILYWKYFKVSMEYSKALKQRISVINNSPKANIVLQPLPESGLIHSYGCNDEVWLNNVFALCFDKKITIRVLNHATTNQR